MAAQNVGDYYTAPFYGYHLGVDLPATPGTAVHAIANGVVKYWSWVRCLGNAVHIEHTLPDGKKRVSVYYHIEKKDVILGTTVTRGQVIGYVRKLPAVCGTGNHLHFGIRLKEYNTGNDCRTHVWFYPGYTSLHVKSCQDPPLPYLKDAIQDQSDSRHGAILAEWEQYPLAFIDAHSSPPLPPPSCPPPSNNATLVPRLDGQAVYDIDRNITWLANANLAATNTFGVSGIGPGGYMTWFTAHNWIDAVNAANYLGFNDWRLPTVTDIGSLGCDYAYVGTDCGFNVNTSTGELAHLYYDELGNKAQYDTSGAGPQTGWGLVNTGPFINIQGYGYWSAESSTNSPWYFNFGYGVQIPAAVDYVNFPVWPVRTGDVTDTTCPSSDCTVSVDNLLAPSVYDNVGSLTNQYGQSFIAQDTSFIGASVYIGDPTRPGIEGVSSLVGPADLVLYQYTSATQVVEVARQRVVGIGQEISGEHRFLFDAPVPTVIGTKYFFGIAASDLYGIGMTNLSSSTYSGGREVVLLSDGTLREAADPGRDFSFRIYSTCAPATVPQCSDGIDNDADGKIDLVDPGCSSPQDNTERSFGVGEF